MFFQSSEGNLEFEYPLKLDRPVNVPTFLLYGIAVKWSSAPTTSESILLRLKVDKDFEVTFDIKSFDPSINSNVDWVFTIPGGPIALPVDVSAQITFANTDSRTVSVAFLGYWK